MKHNAKITAILLAMFLVTQLIGLAVIHAYSPKQQTIFNSTTQQYQNISQGQNLPYGMQPPEVQAEVSIWSIIISMVIAVSLVLILMRVKADIFLKIWFFFVVAISLAITINSAILGISFSQYIALIIALPLAFYKIFKRNIIFHNITELLIYPGIAAVFVPLLSIWSVVILFILISVYDIYAVWYSGFMQKMAKYQINQLKIFSGFFIPYLSKKQAKELIKIKSKNKNIKKMKKVKVSLAILGGGDVVFPIIMAGVVLRSMGFLPALAISLCATLSLFMLFLFARKGKFYPAMPFLTAGCFVGLAVAWIFSIW